MEITKGMKTLVVINILALILLVVVVAMEDLKVSDDRYIHALEYAPIVEVDMVAISDTELVNLNDTSDRISVNGVAIEVNEVYKVSFENDTPISVKNIKDR